MDWILGVQDKIDAKGIDVVYSIAFLPVLDLTSDSVFQVILEPIYNRVSARSTHLEAAYLEALLYLDRNGGLRSIICQYQSYFQFSYL